MNQPKWILEQATISIHEMLLAEHGGATGIRDVSLLKSALAKPKHRLSYDPDTTMFELAASYSFGIAKNHPFVDGNRRTSFTIGVLFLEINGFTFHAPETEAVITIERMASGLNNEAELAKWFKSHSILKA